MSSYTPQYLSGSTVGKSLARFAKTSIQKAVQSGQIVDEPIGRGGWPPPSPPKPKTSWVPIAVAGVLAATLF